MVRTVALIGVSGQLGGQLLKTLGAAQAAGKLKLIALHRPTSDVSAVPSSVEQRVLDLDNASEAEVHDALDGVDILINAGKSANYEFLNHLKGANLQVYIPSWFTAHWPAAEAADKSNPYLFGKAFALQRAKSLGLPVTIVANGLFDTAFFGMREFGGVDARANTLQIYGGEGALGSQFGVVTVPYVAEAVAQLVVSPDLEGGQAYTVTEIDFTGQELVDQLAKVHGKPTAVSDFTDADYAAQSKKGAAQALGAGWRKLWGEGKFTTSNVFEPKGVQKKTLAEVVAERAK